MLLLWHAAMESPRDHRPARLIARVVDGLRSDSFEHEAGLAEIAREFAGWYQGSPDQDLAAQFASDLLRVVAADTDAGEFLKRVDKAKASISKLRLSPAAIRRKKEKLERSKRRALSLLQRIREETSRQLKQSQVEQAVQRTGASPLAQTQIERRRRLAPVADLHVSLRRTP